MIKASTCNRTTTRSSRRALLGLIALFLLLPMSNARAAISCSITSVPDWFVFYNSAGAFPQTAADTVSFTCTRLAADPTSVSWRLLEGNGLHFTTVNQAASGANLIAYDEYKNATCTTKWTNAGTGRLTGSLSFGTALSATFNQVFYGCIPAKIATAPAAGNYTDSRTTTLQYLSGGTWINAPTFTHNVMISTTDKCVIKTPPGNITFTYTSFQTTAATGSTSFALECNNLAAYTMSLDADAPLLGLNYTLALSATAGTGNGLPQTYTINGTLAAGQAGTCATATCSATATRTLTITY